VIGIDITNRRLAELAMEEREKELSRLNETKNLFFSIIGHDLKSPFNSILGFDDLLIENYDELEDVKKKQYIDYIYEGLNHAYKILENLLLWSRSQMDKVSFTPEKLNLYAASHEASELFKFSLAKKSIHLINHIPEHLHVRADKDMLSAIIRNLLSNAVKYTPNKGEIRLETRIIHADKVQPMVEMIVSDNGVGMHPEIVPKLFNIEYKTSTRGTHDEPGTGLSLSICRDFVEKQGGFIWVESEPGIGTTFQFTLPHFATRNAVIETV
jgi:two-component system sensor histidine kinase/response regulator